MIELSELVQGLALQLEQRHWQLVSAESCTGGLIAATLTERPGSSLWFERGFVTYSNEAKEDMLSVKKSLIEQQGAVSEAVALAMALGALKHSRGQIALSVTGIAGPGGGSPEKPVGRVCFGFAVREKTPWSFTKQLLGTRQEIRAKACWEALSEIYNFLHN